LQKKTDFETAFQKLCHISVQLESR